MIPRLFFCFNGVTFLNFEKFFHAFVGCEGDKRERTVKDSAHKAQRPKDEIVIPMSGPVLSPARTAFRDISNDITPNHKPAPMLCDQDTPQQASWTAGDQFKFVEEDDDEVLFRVRDSGVLRSLALPGLTQPDVVTPPNAVNSDETIELKQVSSPNAPLGPDAGSLCFPAFTRKH